MQTPSVKVDEALDEVYFVDGFDAETPLARIVDVKGIASFCITERIATRNAILLCGNEVIDSQVETPSIPKLKLLAL